MPSVKRRKAVAPFPSVPFEDAEREVEWWRNEAALGRPVDVEALLRLCGDLADRCGKAEESAEAARNKIREGMDVLKAALDRYED